MMGCEFKIAFRSIYSHSISEAWRGTYRALRCLRMAVMAILDSFSRKSLIINSLQLCLLTFPLSRISGDRRLIIEMQHVRLLALRHRTMQIQTNKINCRMPVGIRADHP